MNHEVRRAPAEEPLRLAVRNAAGARVDVPSDDGSGNAVVWIDLSDLPSPRLSFAVGMDPGGTAGLSDLQYVVETTAPSEGGATATAAFVGSSPGGGVLCGGRRGRARGKGGSVRYELAIETRTTSQTGGGVDGDDDAMLAEIVAGHAAYHGPVTLTPRVAFRFRVDGPASEVAPGADADVRSEL